MRLIYQSDLEALAPGLDANRYYDAWRLLLLLWRDLWVNSSVDWSKYRLDIWSKFTERVQSAARTAGDLDGFLSRFARLMSLNGIGGNPDDRAELTRLLALPDTERRRIMRLLRDDTAVLVALVRRWKDANKEAFAELERSATDMSEMHKEDQLTWLSQ